MFVYIHVCSVCQASHMDMYVLTSQSCMWMSGNVCVYTCVLCVSSFTHGHVCADFTKLYNLDVWECICARYGTLFSFEQICADFTKRDYVQDKVHTVPYSK